MEGVMNKKVMVGFRLDGVLLTLELCRIVRALGTHTPGRFPRFALAKTQHSNDSSHDSKYCMCLPGGSSALRGGRQFLVRT